MKKLLIVSLLLAASLSAFAQKNSISFNAGYLVSGINGSASGQGYSAELSIDFNGFYIGADYNFALPGFPAFIQTGLNWDYKVAKVNNLSEYANYIRIPVHFKYKFPMGTTVNGFVSGGPSVNVGLFGENSDTFKEGGLNRIHVQLGITAGLEIMSHFIIKLGYDYGVTKAEDIGMSNRIDTLQLGVGYLF